MALISAIMTVYNGENFIKECINSILEQNYKEFELIIVNDGSTDNTAHIIKSFELDKRLKYVELKTNVGVGAAINIGLSYAKGEYIAKVDADDIYDRLRFSKQVAYLNEHKNVVAVDSLFSYFPDNDLVENTDRYWYLKTTLEKQMNAIVLEKDIQKYLYWFTCITHSTIMYRADIFKIFKYNSMLRIAEDYDLFYKINKYGLKIHKIPEVLGKIRVSENSTTVNELSNLVDIILQIKKNELENFLNLNRNIYIWGVGNFGKRVFMYLKQNYNFEISGFIDSDVTKIGSIFMNKKIVNKNYLKRNDFILIASTIGKFEIAQELEYLGFIDMKDYFVLS